ncbi:MAG: hypothetical protein IKO39_08535, partial [Treponema sp.]|nr:hypothetical protein [Treponema sp.]
MKKMYRVLAAALAGTAIYVLVSFTCGRDGIWADGQLREQKRILSARADEIQKINEDFNYDETVEIIDKERGSVNEGKIVSIRGEILIVYNKSTK